MKYIIAILSIIVLCLGLSYWKDSREWAAERQTYTLNDSLLQKKVLEIRDSSNRQIVEYDVEVIRTNQLLQSSSAENQQLRKDLALVKGKLENVQSSTTINAVTHDTIPFQVDHFISVKDTGIKQIPLHYQPDTFITATGMSTFRVVDTGIHYLSTTIDLSVRNSTTMTYFNQSKFLQKEKLKLLITQQNPHTITGKVQTYYLQPEKKLFQKWWFHTAVGAAATLVIIHYVKF